jgi:hypothetical protein
VNTPKYSVNAFPFSAKLGTRNREHLKVFLTECFRREILGCSDQTLGKNLNYVYSYALKSPKPPDQISQDAEQ